MHHVHLCITSQYQYLSSPTLRITGVISVEMFQAVERFEEEKETREYVGHHAYSLLTIHLPSSTTHASPTTHSQRYEAKLLANTEMAAKESFSYAASMEGGGHGFTGAPRRESQASLLGSSRLRHAP